MSERKKKCEAIKNNSKRHRILNISFDAYNFIICQKKKKSAALSSAILANFRGERAITDWIR